MAEPTGCLIFPHATGTGINILHCADNCGLTYDEIALKDVPAGTPFIWVPLNFTEEYGLDPSLRNAWTADFSNPDGYGIGSEAFWEMKNGQGDGQ